MDRYRVGTDQSIEDTWRRVAQWVAMRDVFTKHNMYSLAHYNLYYNLLSDFKFIPGGRITHAAGQPGVTAMNCFVGPNPEDSREGIVKSLGIEIETMSRGGGYGTNMSSLRPRGARVVGVNGTSSGPVPWMELFSTASKDVVQQGGTRRGALMLILEDSHPDIMEFIQAKTFGGRLEGANVSVGISNDFMQAVKDNDTWYLEWNGQTYDSINARELWSAIAYCAWKSGEPGVVFLDRCNEYNNLWYRKDKQIVCVNPCSEIPLPEFGSCLLGTFNLERYIIDDAVPWLDYINLTRDIHTAVRFLDNVIDIAYYPMEQYELHQSMVRQMAIGFTGVADALIKLKIRYGSDEAEQFIDNIYKFLWIEAVKGSIKLAKERGPFPLFDPNLFCEGLQIKKLPNELIQEIKTHGIRNAYLVGQQPSGTGSLLAGVNSGIEPVFSFDTIRTDRTGTHTPISEANKIYEEQATKNTQKPEYLVTAHELTPTEHILMQAAAQKWCDQAISKTVNCPADWSPLEVEDVFNMAWEKGLKSVAIYRDGSRSEQVLHDGEVKNGFSYIIGSGSDIPPDNFDPNCRSGSCEI